MSSAFFSVKNQQVIGVGVKSNQKITKIAKTGKNKLMNKEVYDTVKQIIYVYIRLEGKVIE